MEVAQPDGASPRIPPAFANQRAEMAARAIEEQGAESECEIPEPDSPAYEEKSIGELEEEVAFLAQDHIRNLDEIGFRVYWLNRKYKAVKKTEGRRSYRFP